MSPMEAALQGAKEIGFTVLSISLSLMAVFIPILLMGGIVGRLFREFAVTLSVAILVSLVISLTTTPMMCSRLLKHDRPKGMAGPTGRARCSSTGCWGLTRKTLGWVLQHQFFTLCVLLLTIALNIYLFIVVPKGFFPQQDNGTIYGGIQGAQDISFQSMQSLAKLFVDRVKSDPAVQNVMAFTGGNGSVNGGFVYIGLKPLNERQNASANQVINRLAPETDQHAGRHRLLASRAGFAHRGPAKQRAISVHHSERQRARPGEVGASALAADEKAAGLHRREQRSAEPGTAGLARL